MNLLILFMLVGGAFVWGSIVSEMFLPIRRIRQWTPLMATLGIILHIGSVGMQHVNETAEPITYGLAIFFVALYCVFLAIKYGSDSKKYS